MIECPKCKAQLDEDGCFCDQCGSEIKECPSCRKVGRGSMCTRCGVALVSRRDTDAPSPVDDSGLYLVSLQPGIRVKVEDGAVLGRRTGIYVAQFGTDGYVSGTHCRFDRKGDGYWTVTDLDSTNGTAVNGTALLPNVPCTIGRGSKIRIATREFKIE